MYLEKRIVPKSLLRNSPEFYRNGSEEQEHLGAAGLKTYSNKLTSVSLENELSLCTSNALKCSKKFGWLSSAWTQIFMPDF